jgi:hypothetical protein
MAAVMWVAASNIREAMIPGASQWLVKQQPEAAVTAARTFQNATPQRTIPAPNPVSTCRLSTASLTVSSNGARGLAVRNMDGRLLTTYARQGLTISE